MQSAFGLLSNEPMYVAASSFGTRSRMTCLQDALNTARRLSRETVANTVIRYYSMHARFGLRWIKIGHARLRASSGLLYVYRGVDLDVIQPHFSYGELQRKRDGVRPTAAKPQVGGQHVRP